MAEHVDYPHEPGTLWDCPGCTWWQCSPRDHEENADSWCVSYWHEPKDCE